MYTVEDILNTSKSEIIVITGPTATGKTALGVKLAEEIGGEIVSADSMQIYKHMDIGTAKPTEREKRGIAHFMLDIVSPQEEYSVARYVVDAVICIDDIIKRGKRPIIVGGTGLYIDSLLSGRYFSLRGNDCRRSELSEEYDCIGGEAMLSKLREFDPESANKLHSNDKERIVRAIEVYKTSGKTISEHNFETKSLAPRYNASKFALMLADRAELYDRIDRRVDMMIEKGLEVEVRSLLDMNVLASATAMQAIGYKELAAVIQGKLELVDAIERIKQESRRYAKRQLTWLRRDNSVKWVEVL